MSPKKQRRLAFAIALLLAGGAAAALVVVALRDNVLFFYSPSDLAERPVPPGQSFRIGGLVETGSFTRGQGLEVSFKVTDGKSSVPVRYSGLLPDLFREGQGVVALGARDPDGTFAAREILAKHDENYMPPEVVEALKKAGQWEDGRPAPGTQ
jgi:cytochrome c-type biogenesis protein CcmE